MFIDFVIFLIIAIISITSVGYLKDNLIKFREQIDRQFDDNLNELHKFSYDIHFEPFPEKIEITNTSPCDHKTLKKCKLDDFRTCMGCQNLTATCQHFDKNTTRINYDGSIDTIPKNKNINEGYCLSIRPMKDICNPYHGDLILMQLKPDSLDSMLICNCKYPGYIGKTTIQGNCNKINICNGKVKDLNKPFEELECDCENGYTSVKIKKLPYCKPMNVMEYENYDSLTFNKRSSSTESFDLNIRGNYSGKQLLDPCGVCVLTGRSVNGRQTRDQDTVQCVANDNTCLPIRLNRKNRILEGLEGPDAMIGIEWDEVLIFGHINSAKYHDIAVKFSYDKNKEIYEILNLSPSENYLINMLDHQVVFPGSFKSVQIDSVPMGVCQGDWPTYICKYLMSSDLYGFKTHKIKHNILRMYNGRDIPSSFLWYKEFWQHVERNMNPSVDIKESINYLPHLSINENLRGRSIYTEALKFLYLIYDNTNNKIIMVNTKSLDDYIRYNNKLIKLN